LYRDLRENCFFTIYDEINKEKSRAWNALSIVQLCILISLLLAFISYNDSAYAQIRTLNTERIMTPIIPFSISNPFSNTGGTTDSTPRAADDSGRVSSSSLPRPSSSLPRPSSSPAVPLVITLLYVGFDSGTYSLRDDQTSPNGVWHNIYNGGGSSGVLYGGGGNNVFYMYPRTATSPGQTYASAVETKRKFSNFELFLGVKTVKN
jgi:hypothetical protein